MNRFSTSQPKLQFYVINYKIHVKKTSTKARLEGMLGNFSILTTLACFINFNKILCVFFFAFAFIILAHKTIINHFMNEIQSNKIGATNKTPKLKRAKKPKCMLVR